MFLIHLRKEDSQMKPNKLTPGQNLKWEASRMMLPEHVTQLQQYRLDCRRKKRPELDEQQLEEFQRMLRDYIQSNIPLFLTIYGEFEDRDVRGKITKMDPLIKRVKLEFEEGEFEWISFHDIVDIYL